VRAVVEEGVAPNAILISQQGVSRTPKGEPIALVVDKADTVQQKMLKLDRAIGDTWLVSSGLAAGDRVIVEGIMNVRPGVVVKVVSFDNRKKEAKPEVLSQRRENRTKGDR
jgi:membrane fusion protein (multidrug efflux system)